MKLLEKKYFRYVYLYIGMTFLLFLVGYLEEIVGIKSQFALIIPLSLFFVSVVVEYDRRIDCRLDALEKEIGCLKYHINRD